MQTRYKLLALTALAFALSACGGAGGNDDDPKAGIFNITTIGMPDAVVGVPYAWQLQSINGHAPVAFDWDTGFTPPAWLSLSPTGKFTGTPAAGGSITLEVKATDSGMIPVTAPRTLQLEVLPAPRITTAALARSIRGQPYSEQITHDAPASLSATFALGSGTLPPGITLSAGGTLAGTTTVGGLHVLGIDLLVDSTVVDSASLDLVVYESIPFTYVQDVLENNDGTGTGTQLFPTATPSGRLTMATTHVQAEPLTLNSDQNIAKPDGSDFFKFNTGTVGTIKVEVFVRALVGEIDAYLWFYAGAPTHVVSVVAKSERFQVDDELIVYHNAQLSGGMGMGFYYLEVRAPGDAVAALWSRNAYTFRVSFNDLTVATDKLEADSPGGVPINVPVVAYNQGAAPIAPQWSIVFGALPAGVTFTQDGRFTGTPTEFGLRDFTVQVSAGGILAQRAIRVRFFDSVAGGYWQVKGERRLYNGTTNPVFNAFGDPMVVAPHPDYPAEGAIYVLGGRTDTTLDMVRVFHTDRAGIPAAKQFMFEDINKPMQFARRYHGACFVQHSYGGYIYVVGGEINAAVTPGHVVGDFFYGVERLQLANGAGVALPHPLATNWEPVADLPKTEGPLNIKGWAEFGLVANDAASDSDDRLYLVGGRHQIEDTVGAGTYSMKFHNAMLMYGCPTTAGGTGSWFRKLDANPYSPCRFPGIAMLNGRIYLAAGRQGAVGQTGSGGAPMTGVQMIQPDPTGTNPALATAGAAQFPNLTEPVYYPMFATLNGALYVWCGWDANVAGTSRLHRFVPNPATGIGGTLTRLADADWGTGFGGGVCHDGKLWIISGIGHGTEASLLNLRYTP